MTLRTKAKAESYVVCSLPGIPGVPHKCSMRRLQKMYSKHLARLRRTGEGVGGVGEGGPVHNECLVPADGPDRTTPQHTVNLWSECTLSTGQHEFNILQTRSIKNFHGLRYFTAFFHPDQTLSLLRLLLVLGQLGERPFTITLRHHLRVVILISTLRYTPLALAMPHPCSRHNHPLAWHVLHRISHPRHCLCSPVFHPNFHHFHSQLPKPHCHYLNKILCPPLHDQSSQP